MKKYYTSPKFKKWNYERQQKELKDSLRYKRWRTSENHILNGMNEEDRERYVRLRRFGRDFKKRYYDHLKIEAPTSFSFKKNPEEVVRFINALESAKKNKKKTFVVLRKVREIDYDAIVILLPVMISFAIEGIEFNGDFPYKKKVRKVLEDSKFFEQLAYARDTKEKKVKQPNYSIGEQDGICTHGTDAVDPMLTSRVIRRASETIWGEARRCQGVQNVLLELMQNTYSHAAKDGETKRYWWLSVSHDHVKKKVRFAFVDYGIGIFESLKTKPSGSVLSGILDLLKRNKLYETESEALELILDGKLHATSTGEEYRGKGLPALKEAFERGDIKDLCLISNSSYVNVSENERRDLQNMFSGTFICWQIDETVNSVSNQNL